MDQLDYLTRLIGEAYADLDRPEGGIVRAVRTATRIARLRRDYESLLWLELQLTSIARDGNDFRRVREQIGQHFSPEAFENVVARAVEDSLRTRLMKGGKVQSLSLQELEALRCIAVEEEPNLRLGSAAQTENYEMITEIETMFRRVQSKVYRFLSETETQIYHGEWRPGIFQRTHELVKDNLLRACPEALNQLTTAEDRLEEGGGENNNLAMLACRRALKSFADAIYPSPEKPVRGADGNERALGTEQYTARLWQFIYENLEGKTHASMLHSELETLGNKVDRIYKLANKGVHSDVSDIEAKDCVIQAYLLVASVLRLRDKSSALLDNRP